jgi:hypothetical protein
MPVGHENWPCCIHHWGYLTGDCQARLVETRTLKPLADLKGYYEALQDAIAQWKALNVWRRPLFLMPKTNPWPKLPKRVGKTYRPDWLEDAEEWERILKPDKS